MRATILLVLVGLLAAAPAARADCDADASHHHHHDHHFDWGMSLFGWGSDPDETRIQVLDLAVFSLVDVHSRAPHHSRIEVLEAPLITGFESSRSEHHRAIRVLDVPLFSLFELDRHEDDLDVGVFNLPLIGSLYRHRSDAHGQRTNMLFLLRFSRPAVQAAGNP